MSATELLALASAIVAAQPALIIPAHDVVVINNTRAQLTCSYRWAGRRWNEWFNLRSGGEWNELTAFTSAEFQCRPPVRPLRYTLAPGRRYSLLRAADGEVDLVEVTAGAPTGPPLPPPQVPPK